MLAVKNFDKFQHYKDRSPVWIKLYRSLLRDYEFASLPDAARGQLLLIWLLASETGNELPNDAAWIGRQINATEPVNIELLISSGFLIDTEKCASKSDSTVAEPTLANLLAQNREREEREESREEVGAVAQPPPKPKPVKPKPEAKPVHVAIQTCREVAKQYPPKELWDKVIETLGDTPNVLLLAECRREWVERGYNRASWKWATEWYVTGVPPRVAHSPPKPPGNAHVGKHTPAPQPFVPTAEDNEFMSTYIETLIAEEDLIHMGNEYDNIIKRGGAQLEWEIRVVTWYELHKDEPATPEQVAQIYAGRDALANR